MALCGARCLPDHLRLLRSDIGAARLTEIEDDGAVGPARPFGQIQIHEAAYILGQRYTERCRPCASLRMSLRIERYLGSYHHCGSIMLPC